MHPWPRRSSCSVITVMGPRASSRQSSLLSWRAGYGVWKVDRVGGCLRWCPMGVQRRRGVRRHEASMLMLLGAYICSHLA